MPIAQRRKSECQKSETWLSLGANKTVCPKKGQTVFACQRSPRFRNAPQSPATHISPHGNAQRAAMCSNPKLPLLVVACDLRRAKASLV
jgi:hypothetical protein